MKTGDYSVKGVKRFKGHDGYGFNANLYKGKKKVAEIVDDNWGGEYMYTWVDRNSTLTPINVTLDSGKAHTFRGTPNEKEFREFVDTIGEVDDNDGLGPMKVCMDILVGYLVHKFEQVKEIKGWCRNKTVFSLKGDKEGVYRTVKVKFDKKVKDFINNKYGNKLVEILNERFVQVA